MIDVRLLPEQRKLLFDHIVACGVVAALFRLEEGETTERLRRYTQTFRADRVLYVPQPEFYFQFGGLRVQWSPSETMRVQSMEHLGDFGIKYSCFRMWLSALIGQISIPDPWSQLSSEVLSRTVASVEEATSELKLIDKTTTERELKEAMADLSRVPNPDLTGAVQHALAALECITREHCGDTATMGKLIERYPALFPKPLDASVEKVWGFASEMGRHIREGRLPEREEVELLVGLSAVWCAYIARKFKNGRIQ